MGRSYHSGDEKAPEDPKKETKKESNEIPLVERQMRLRPAECIAKGGTYSKDGKCVK